MAGRLTTNAPKRGRGRPRIFLDKWSKVSVVLFERQVAALDLYVTDIRRHRGNIVNRAGVIRAAIDALLGCRIDCRVVQSEADLRARLVRRLRGRAGSTARRMV